MESGHTYQEAFYIKLIAANLMISRQNRGNILITVSDRDKKETAELKVKDL